MTESVFATVLADARRFREDFAEDLASRLDNGRSTLAEVDRREAEAIQQLAKARALLERCEARHGELEKEIFAKAIEGDERKLARLVERKGRCQARIGKIEERVDNLKRARGRFPNERERLVAHIARLEAMLEPDALDAEAVAYGVKRGERLQREAVVDRVGAADRKRVEKAREFKTDRDKPTPEAIARRGVRSVSETGGVRLGADVPEVLRRLRRHKQIDDGALEAAAMYQQDYSYGHASGSMVSSYEARGGKSTGGSNRAEHVAADRIAAASRYRAARAAVPGEFLGPLEAVVLHGSSVDSVPGTGEMYAAGSTNRRSAGLVLVVCDLNRLKEFYQSKFGCCV